VAVVRHFNSIDLEVQLGRIEVAWQDGPYETYESIVVDPLRDYVRRQLNGRGLILVTEQTIDNVLGLSESTAASLR
jgi:hypothetical protein